MRKLRSLPGRFFTLLPALVLLCDPPALRASPTSDFQARLAQANWCLHQTEAILRAQPLSAVPVPTPDALASYLTLLSENVAALSAAAAAARVTDEQRKIMAEGLKSMAAGLQDGSSLAGNRGLTAIASSLAGLETSCRSAMSQF